MKSCRFDGDRRPRRTHLSIQVNGQMKQDSNSRHLVDNIERPIEYASIHIQYVHLLPRPHHHDRHACRRRPRGSPATCSLRPSSRSGASTSTLRTNTPAEAFRSPAPAEIDVGRSNRLKLWSLLCVQCGNSRDESSPHTEQAHPHCSSVATACDRGGKPAVRLDCGRARRGLCGPRRRDLHKCRAGFCISSFKKQHAVCRGGADLGAASRRN